MFNHNISEYYSLDDTRREVSKFLDPERRTELGQYMTPNSIASFMASLFTYGKNISLLDPGAGIGSLSSAFIEAAVKFNSSVQVEAWEIDPSLLSHLRTTLDFWSHKCPSQVTSAIHMTDFIDDASFLLGMSADKSFTHAILNPPYKKINSNSIHRRLLRDVGIETVNLYSAFVALTIGLLSNKGELVAIIPRSFCNGPYYLPFRKILLENTAIKQIHLFQSRSKAFRDDDVLQENIIIHLVKGAKSKDVIISTSHDAVFNDYSEHKCDYSSIVDLNSDNKFIHIPSNESELNAPDICTHTLSEIGLQVSTGPVVDFRVKEYLQTKINSKSIPLIYSFNFTSGKFVWPKEHKKPNALKLTSEIKKMLMPKGHYVLVKRFSSKEEKRRLVAFHLTPEDLESELIGFENHLNVYHFSKKGIDGTLARGLTIFLNSKLMDDHFRVFSGHTQVNATDLRTIRYPSREQLIELGSKSIRVSDDQNLIDNLIADLK